MASLPPIPRGGLLRWALQRPEEIEAFLRRIVALSNLDLIVKTPGGTIRVPVQFARENATAELDVSAGADAASGGTSDVTAGATYAKGDLLAGRASGSLGTVSVGMDGQILVADSEQPGGVAWADQKYAEPLTFNGEVVTINDEPVMVVATRAWFDAQTGDGIEEPGIGLLADLPPAKIAGRFYIARDSAQLFFDTGGAWEEIVFPGTPITTHAEPLCAGGQIVFAGGDVVMVLGVPD